MRGHEGLVRGAPAERHAEGGRVGRAVGSLADLVAETRARNAARSAEAERLAQAGRSVRFSGGDGRRALAGQDMSKPGAFRLTLFDDQGPVGHVERGSLREAILDALQRGYAVEEAPDRYAEGGRVGRVLGGLGAAAEALREGVAPRTRQNPRGLPMDEASRRARAEALGYSLDDVRYHGTSADEDYRTFRAKDRGTWTSTDPREASSYAMENDSQRMRWTSGGTMERVNDRPRVIPVVSRASSVYSPTPEDLGRIARAQGATGYQRAQAQLFREVRAGGHDAVDMGGGVRVDLDPRNLRVPHATFDPERAHEADLLAGVGAGLAGGAAAGLGGTSEPAEPPRYAEGGLAHAQGLEGGGRVGRMRELYRGLGRPMEEGLRRFLAERPIGIGAPDRAAESILRDGRFRTQFETGTSRGMYDPELRARAESELLGVPSDVPSEERPVYGALRSAIQDELPSMQRAGHGRNAWEAPNMYGRNIFLLRPEAKERSTYTLDDSLIMSPAGSGRPADMTGALGRAFRFSEPPPRARDLAEALLAGGAGNRLEGLPSAAEWSRLNHLQREREWAVRQGMAEDLFSLRALPSSFVETQTRGPVTTDDVAALLVPPYGDREDAIRDYARGRGIPVYRHYEVEEDRDLQRALGLRLVPGAVGAGAAFEGLVGREEGGAERYQDGGRVGLLSRGLGAALRAYHGSPHAFDRFSLDHIGRGEGAQAYGHGLYFAENEAVARHYRDALARTSRAYNAVDGQRFTDAVRRRIEAEDPDLAGFLRTWVPPRYYNSERLMPHLRDLRRSVDEQLDMFRERRADRVRSDEDAAAGGPRAIHSWSIEDYDERIGGLESRAAELARVMPRFQRVPERRHAHMYEVNLHVDPDRLLDWDAPLASQSAAVREGVLDVASDFAGRAPEQGRRSLDRLASDDTIRGGDALRALGGESPLGLGHGFYRVYGPQPVTPAAASEALLERGIPGVRYLDGVSRQTGEGNRNFVMFDDEAVEIVRRYRDGGVVEDEADARLRLRMRAIPAARAWLDEFAFDDPPRLVGPDVDYDYAEALRQGVVPSPYRHDGGRHHWPSVAPDGTPLKRAGHPTGWMEEFQRRFGVDPHAAPAGALARGRAEGVVPEGWAPGRRYAAGGLADVPASNAPGPEDDLAHTQGATQRGLAQAAQMWGAAGQVLRGWGVGGTGAMG